MIPLIGIQHDAIPNLSMTIQKRQMLHAKAASALSAPVPHITDVSCSRSAGGIHDFYSEGDYWWPDPAKPDGLPYIRRDGETNPDNFTAHRLILRQMRNQVASLTLEALLSEDENTKAETVSHLCEKVEKILQEFFVNSDTRMNPDLSFAQAIHGVCKGRGIGIIDTIHLADVPYAAEALYRTGKMKKGTWQGIRKWFSDYLGWMLASSNGIDEMNANNNHAVCFFMQAAVFARFTDNPIILQLCREQFRQRLLPQMEKDGSFPLELARTKPYNYSAFTLDNLCLLAEAASIPEDDLWKYQSPQGQSLSKGIDFLLPYLKDKNKWPYPHDISHFEAFPVPYAFLFFAGVRLGREDCMELYNVLPDQISDEEALRNLSVRSPRLWLPLQKRSSLPHI